LLSIGLQSIYMMSRIQKATRLLVLICLIVLAGLGVGISGGVPIPTTQKRKDSEKEKMELLENQAKESDSQQAKI